MHILLIHQAFAGLNEAGGTRHMELSRYLVQRGHQITIIASPVSYLSGKQTRLQKQWVNKENPEPGITILRTYTYASLRRSFLDRILGFISFMASSFFVGLGVTHVDLVWGTSPPIFQGFTAWLLSWLKRVPFLFEVRDLWPAFAIAMGVLRNPVLVNASLWLEKFLYQHADRVVVNSPGFIHHVSDRGARWIELIPNGADPTMFSPDDSGSDFRQKYKLDKKFIVLYAGAHGPSNDLQILIQASAQLSTIPQIHIVLVGDGKEKKDLQSQAQTLGLTNVTFISPVAKSEMSQVLAAANVCVAILKPLELYKTTYPNKVFDYMAAARPVILAIDGVIRELIETAHAGIPVTPGRPAEIAAAVRKLYENPPLGREMGISGRTYVEIHFSRAIQAEKLALLVEDMRRNYV
jgi:glycosyltransferase involved in cell wall biosynthesis